MSQLFFAGEQSHSFSDKHIIPCAKSLSGIICAFVATFNVFIANTFHVFYQIQSVTRKKTTS